MLGSSVIFILNAASGDLLNPLAPPKRRLEGIREILCLVHDFTVGTKDRAIHKALHEMTIEVMLLTGDTRGAAEAVADRLGIVRVYAELLPQQKSNFIAGGPIEGEVPAHPLSRQRPDTLTPAAIAVAREIAFSSKGNKR